MISLVHKVWTQIFQSRFLNLIFFGSHGLGQDHFSPHSSNPNTLTTHGLNPDFFGLTCLKPGWFCPHGLKPDSFGPHGLNLDFFPHGLKLDFFGPDSLNLDFCGSHGLNPDFFLSTRYDFGILWFTRFELRFLLSSLSKSRSEHAQIWSTRSEHKTTTSNQEDIFAHDINKTKENDCVKTLSRKFLSKKNCESQKVDKSWSRDTLLYWLCFLFKDILKTRWIKPKELF